MLHKLSLRLRIFLIFAGLALGALAGLAGGLVFGYRQLGTPETLNAFVQVGMLAGLVVLGLVTWVWYLFDLNVAKPIDILSGALRARAHSDVSGEMDAALARYLGDLAPAATAAAASLSETRNALAEAVARETTRLSAEKARLEALLSDVPVGVLLCSADHQLAFYNGTAADMLGGAGAPGLDRRLFDYLHDGPLRHAHQRLQEAGDPDAASDILCTTRSGARVLAGRMRLLEAGGYVLTLRDVTADLAQLSRREALLAETFDRIRRPAANLGTLFAVLPEGEALPPQMERALRDEVERLGAAVTELTRRHDEGRAEAVPLAPIRASDLVDGIAARMEAQGLSVHVGEVAPLLLRCNGFEIVGLAGRLGAALAEARGLRAFTLDLTERGADARITLGWQGEALPVGQLEHWLDQPLEDGLPDTTGRSVLAAHATEIWPEGRPGQQAVVLPLRAARRAGPRPAPVARAVVYDFDLLSKARNAAVSDTRLEDLTYVVFDTETTGLLPAQGDEIVQIAAVRIVNGKRVAAEVFDTLVNPGRPIPPASTTVHGITDAMVAGAPGIAEVGRAFHAFADGAVLVAHNAPFDLDFLRRKEGVTGVRFDNPVLDTVLLSAVIFGQHEVHSLDALTHRLDITIPEEARHTAIGDTVATADAFLKLMPMLRGRGLTSFGEVVAEVRRHGRLLRDMN
ncbi:exonuclease domain-containing protein [Gemmobacter caeruleus]|uniref:exonuclease domain-containing protein n=1 Tax=Gemmobacter caeruleus TaxID=2595004 RepID=UPI0011EC4AF9|nr:exonuclease domain-containing protein [Gemmobacter caeruleus]